MKFRKSLSYDDVLLAPHPIFDVNVIEPTSMNLPYDLNDKFVIFSMSQWTHRKGFDKLLKAFTAELGDLEDCVLILKTFPSGEARTPQDIANTVNGIRNTAKNKIQENEFAREKDGYTSVKHQREVGTSYFDAVSNTISSGKSSTTAMEGSTESEQF